jgi:3-deoxy-D-manno-octulosonic-acid transferase
MSIIKKEKKVEYNITYFPMEQKYSVWQNIEGKAPKCLNGFDSKNWFDTIDQARNFLNNYKRKLRK